MVFLSVNGGGQLGAPNFRHAVSYPFRSPPDTLNVTVGSDYPVEDGGMFDVGGGVYVRPDIAIGTTFTRTSQTRGASLFLNADSPGGNVDPLHFSGTTSVYGIYFYSITDRLTVAFFGGPSYLFVTQSERSMPSTTCSRCRPRTEHGSFEIPHGAPTPELMSPTSSPICSASASTAGSPAPP